MAKKTTTIVASVPPVRKMLDVPPVEWQAMALAIRQNEGQPSRSLSDLEALAEQAIRLHAYLAGYLSGLSHGRAVDRSNRIGRGYRRQMGYACPEAGDLNF